MHWTSEPICSRSPFKTLCDQKKEIGARGLRRADWLWFGHDRRGTLRIHCRPPDGRLARAVVIHLVDIVCRFRKRVSSLNVGNCWLARFVFKNAAAPLQDYPRWTVMMMPPRTVARFQRYLLNLNQAGPRATGKNELGNRTSNGVLKAKCKGGTRQCYPKTDCNFPFPVHFLCSFQVGISLRGRQRGRRPDVLVYVAEILRIVLRFYGRKPAIVMP